MPSVVVPSGNTTIVSPAFRCSRTRWFIDATACRRPRSMYSVPERVTSAPSSGQRPISAFATNRHGVTALIANTSSHETWFASASRPRLHGSRPVARMCGAIGAPSTTSRAPQIATSVRDHARLTRLRPGRPRNGNTMSTIASPARTCSTNSTARSGASRNLTGYVSRRTSPPTSVYRARPCNS